MNVTYGRPSRLGKPIENTAALRIWVERQIILNAVRNAPLPTSESS